MARTTATLLSIVLGALLCVSVVYGEFDPKDGRHNILEGNRVFRDSLLFNDTQKMKSVWVPYPKVQSADVCYPTQGAQMSKINITAFQVQDLEPTGDGGFAFVTEGGVNFNKLCLHLKTQRGKGFHFNITIWGLLTY